MNVDDYLILTDDEIEFDALDVDSVAALASQEFDPFIATSALGNLFKRDQPQTTTVASEILRRAGGDEHLRAFALTTLFSLAPEAAVHEMQRLLQGQPDVKVLEAMVENVMSDAERFRTEPLIATLRTKLKVVPLGEFSDPDEMTAFMALDALK